MRYGTVWINDHLTIASEMPHGGFGRSGYGKDMSTLLDRGLHDRQARHGQDQLMPRRIMRVLLIGVGTVGEAIARISADRPWLEQMILADYDADRARFVVDSVDTAARTSRGRIDASSASTVAAAARDYEADLVMNAVDPQFVMPIFDGALEADANYMDMAMSLSKPQPSGPFEQPGVKLGDEQFAMAAEWERAGRLALGRAWAWIPA